MKLKIIKTKRKLLAVKIEEVLLNDPMNDKLKILLDRLDKFDDIIKKLEDA